MPNDTLNRLPLPNYHQHNDIGDENKGASLKSLGDELRPPLLKSRTGHDGVLDGEDEDQQEIYKDGRTDGANGTGINGNGDGEVAEESYHVDQPCHETCIRNDSVDEAQYSFHYLLLKLVFPTRKTTHF